MSLQGSSGNLATKLLESIDADIKRVNEEIDGLKRLRDSLERSRQSLSSDVIDIFGMSNGAPRRSRVRKSGNALSGMARTDAIEKLLAEATEPMSPDAIAEALRAAGRTDTGTHVRQTLGYLRSKGIAKTPTRGMWVAVAKQAKAA